MLRDNLVTWLTAAGVPTYLDTAPRELTRCAVIRPMPGSTIDGDSTQLIEFEQYQIDLYATTRADNILAVTRNKLLDHMFLPDVVEPLTYDDEYNIYRAILTVELF